MRQLCQMQVTVPSQVQTTSRLHRQYQREWLVQYPLPGVPEKAAAPSRDCGLPHGTGVASISRSISEVAGVASASQHSAAFHQRREMPQPLVVLAQRQQTGEQAPDER